MMNHNGKEYEKEYICITESLCCTAEIKHNLVNQLYFNKILKRVWYLVKNHIQHKVNSLRHTLPI